MTTPLPHLAPTPPKKCHACGRYIEEDVARKAIVGGRPKEYCDATCKNLYHWLGQAEEMIRRLAERSTPERWAEIRAQVWGALNSRAWNRGVARIPGKGRAAAWSK